MKRYLIYVTAVITTTVIITACTSYRVNQNSNNGPTCEKGIGHRSILDKSKCAIFHDGESQ